MLVGGQRHAPTALTPGKDPVPIVQEAGMVPGPVWTHAENLAPHPPGFDLRTVQPRRERLYRLRTPRPTKTHAVSYVIPLTNYRHFVRHAFVA